MKQIYTMHILLINMVWLLIVQQESTILAAVAAEQRGEMSKDRLLPHNNPAVTPYPLAGPKPEVPFELPTETMRPPSSQLNPVYGIPTQFPSTIDNGNIPDMGIEDLSDHVSDLSFITPDIGYGPPHQPDINGEPNAMEEKLASMPQPIDILPKLEQIRFEHRPHHISSLIN